MTRRQELNKQFVRSNVELSVGDKIMYLSVTGKHVYHSVVTWVNIEPNGKLSYDTLLGSSIYQNRVITKIQIHERRSLSNK